MKIVGTVMTDYSNTLLYINILPHMAIDKNMMKKKFENFWKKLLKGFGM